MRTTIVATVIAVFALTGYAYGQGINAGGGTTNPGGAANNGGGQIGGVGQNQTGIGQGGGGFGGGFGAGGAEEFGQSLGTNTGFVGQNQNTQQGAFVGGNQAGGQVGGGQFGNAGGAGGRGVGGRGVGGGRQGQAGQPQQRSQQRNIRIKLRIDPEFARAYRVVPPAKLQSRLANQYRRIDQIQADTDADLGLSRVFKNANVSVVARGRTVTLSGQVATERERSLAARIASLESGVDRVINQITVRP